MQGKGGIIEFDQGSSSNNSSIDRQAFFCDMLSPIHNREIANHLLSSEDNMLPFPNMPNHDSGSFSAWNCDNPELGEHATMKSFLDEATSGHERTSALVSNSGTSLRLHERRFESRNMLSLENVDIDIDQNTSEQERTIPQNSGDIIDFVGNSDQVAEAGVCNLFDSCLANAEQIQSGIGSTSSCGASAGNRYLPRDGDGRPQCSLDSRISGKRKITEGVSEQSSVSGSVDFLRPGEKNKQVVSVETSQNGGINISNSSMSPGTNTLEGIRPRFEAVIRATASRCNSSANAATSAENSHRNVRRINSAQDRLFTPPTLWPSGNSTRQPNIWAPNQASSFSPSHFQLPEADPALFFPISEAQSTEPAIPVQPESSHAFPWGEASNSIASSSSGDGIPVRRVIRSIPVPFTDMRHLAQDPRNWNLSLGNSTASNVASSVQIGSSSSSQPSPSPSPSPTWQPHQNISRQHPSRLSEFVRRSFSTYGSDSGVQSNNIDLQNPIGSTSSQEVAANRGAGPRSRQQLLRSALLADRQNDRVVGIPLSLRMAAVREGRSRMISEIHNALDFIRRGESLRIEDVLMLDRTFIGGVNFPDRHRDLRLDVDNMSYEELLALEERIGDVNTGLTDEMVMKNLKQQKYSSNTLEKPENIEPCCICQEEYVEGEDLGALDCGHSFHAECIKQWLSYKNLCPICKTTGLVAGIGR